MLVKIDACFKEQPSGGIRGEMFLLDELGTLLGVGQTTLVASIVRYSTSEGKASLTACTTLSAH